MAVRTKKRSYRGEYRREQAAAQVRATRDRILAAARRRFGEDGYPSTTVEAIAREVGVAVPTVYANFPTKLALLQAMIASLKSDPELKRISAVYISVAGAEERLRAGLRYVREYMERYSDVERIVRSAGSAEPELAARWGYGDQARRRHARQLVASLVTQGDLKVGLLEAEAVDILHLLSSPEVYEILVRGSKWTSDHYENWLRTTAETLLINGDRRRSKRKKERA